MHRYESDIVAWANEQAALLRAGQFNMLDLEHIADEIEDQARQDFSRKLKWGPSDFSSEK
ncbi:DUF29 family protein [Methylotuvimicrobium buryatense]|uniref:DUF29 family protein n=1 Tax=Methylotuvimicrobium buryatense TaxID=95641 RepID=UPI0003487DDF|nr:DUF29 family protein [Methylotuvimicrobium buryatense]